MTDLGKIAYNAYRTHSKGRSLVTNMRLPDWEDLDEDVQYGWRVAADAVMEDVDRRARAEERERVLNHIETFYPLESTPADLSAHDCCANAAWALRQERM